MARVIHTGDTHIGYRQYHSAERRRDFLDAFDNVIDDAIEQEVDGVIHAGDLFHDTSPAIPDLMSTIEILKRLAAADIPFLGIVGNHEATRDRQWLDLFADLDLAHRLDENGVRIGDTTIYGLDYVPPSRRSALEYDFELAETTHSVLVAHGLFEPFAHADWDTDHVLTSATVDFDALLLGDNHAWGQERVNDTWVTYCGSTARTSAAEREDRGYNIVTLEEGSVSITRRRIESARQWEFVDVTLHGDEGTEHVVEAGRSRHIEDAVVIVRVSGDGTDISPAVIEERLSEAGALIVRVIDEREVQETETATVDFADPDQAVDQRIRDLPLSGAGELIDVVVRDEAVADANVRDRVRTRVETLLAETPGAFERQESRSPSASATDESPTEEERNPAPESDAESTTDEEPDPAREPDEESNDDGQASIAEFG